MHFATSACKSACSGGGWREGEEEGERERWRDRGAVVDAERTPWAPSVHDCHSTVQYSTVQYREDTSVRATQSPAAEPYTWVIKHL